MSVHNLLRITQINAIYLDEEVFRLFNEMLQNISRHLPLGCISPFEPELELLLRLAIIKYSLFNKNATFGQDLVNIKYSNLTGTRKVLYLFTHISSYIKKRCELSRPFHYMNVFNFRVYTVWEILHLLNLSLFLRSGSKPKLIERILGLNQVYDKKDISPRLHQSKYLARELLWNGFIEFLLFIVPMINYRKMMRMLKNFSPLHRKSYTLTLNRNMTIQTKCAHCGQNPILPHHMECSHIFCYICLSGNQKMDSKYECPLCEHKNVNTICRSVSM
ncbi:peroxisome biogenesis factor 2 [Cylas formicarius]|uniref:peroxisome biogenesis factor 2 n=1 Tax=Cylas formicarius TaxID=197179 RepID=UPI0029585065|nr:peroxisome biogenesis factor 2 [Cylas formicarius]